MQTEKLEKVVIKKPLTEKEIQGFKKFYLKGKYYLDDNYLVEIEETCELISLRDDYWSSEGWRKDTIMEDGEVVRKIYDTYNAYKHSNTYTRDIKDCIDFLLKDKNSVIIGYKSPEKMKGHSHKAPSKHNYNMFGNIKGLENSVKKIF